MTIELTEADLKAAMQKMMENVEEMISREILNCDRYVPGAMSTTDYVGGHFRFGHSLSWMDGGIFKTEV